MKSVSELNHQVFYPTGDEWLIVNKQEGLGYKSYKVKLSDIKDWMPQPVQGEKYIVELDPNGGTLNGSSEVQTLELTLGASSANLPTPTQRSAAENHAGVQFDGWWTEEWDGNQVMQNVAVPTTPGRIKLYAHWKGVIHYRKVGNVNISNTGIASGFSNLNYIQTVATEQFDFSKNFWIVTKGQIFKNSEGYWQTGNKMSMFSGDSNNPNMDFGLGHGGSPCIPEWEICKFSDFTSGTHASGPTQDMNWYGFFGNGEFYLGVTQIDGVVRGYFRQEQSNIGWTLDYEGPGNGGYHSGTFVIGMDPDGQSSGGEIWTGNIHLNDWYLRQLSTDAKNPKGKYVLEPAV